MELSRKERKDARKLKKAIARHGLPNYYNRDKEVVSAGGIVYYPLQVSKLVHNYQKPRDFVGMVAFAWVKAVLGLK